MLELLYYRYNRKVLNYYYILQSHAGNIQSFKQLMKESSGRQRGTLMQLRNVIKATAIPKDPKQNFKRPRTFCLEGYVVAAAKDVMRNSDETVTVQEVSEHIVDEYV